MVSHPEIGSDSPIGSDRDRGRDIRCQTKALDRAHTVLVSSSGFDYV